MIMKKTKDRHINDRTVKRHATRLSCFKRAGVLLLCMLVWLTSDPSIMDAFTVQAEEENNLKCVITSFLPLPEEVTQQSVCVGTPMEELLFPDTLEAVCTYEDGQESSSDDIEKEDSEEEGKTPVKPKPDDQNPSESEDGDETSEEPEQGDQAPAEPEDGDQASPELGNSDQTPTGPEDDDHTPKAPEVGDGTPETPDGNGNTPEAPEQGGSTSVKQEETDPTSGESEQGGQNAEESVTDIDSNADRADANSSVENTGVGGIDSLPVDYVNTLTDEMSRTEKTVYVDKLESMISAVRDKAFSLLGGVSIEETQVTMETNLTEPEEESDVQTLTNIVIVSPVTWEGVFEYDSELAGCYIFTPVLPEGFLLADDVALPEIVVIVMNEESEAGKAKSQTISALADDAISDKCGENLTWKYENGTLTISGSGAMYDFDIAPWNEYANKINSISIDGRVTTIGNYAFFDCSSLGSVNLPGNITSIGTAAFFGCSSLGSVTIPNGVTSIGSLAFNGCSNLGNVEIPASVSAITAYTFRNCSNAIIYYPASLSGPGNTKDTKANIGYTVSDGLTTLRIVSVGANVSAIHFPEMIGSAKVGAANWNEYEGTIKITHASFPEHRYTDSSECTICGEQKAPEIKIDFLHEKLIGFEQGKTYTYSIAGTSGTLSNSTELDIDENWLGETISIALKNSGSSTGKTQDLLIPTRPIGPTGITTSNVTSKGNDGKLLNVSSKMEYWKKGASPEAIVGITGETVENLPAGTYCVRFKAVENTSFSSQIVEVVIGEYEPIPEEKPTAEIDYVNESLIELEAGDTYHIVCGTTETNVTAKTDGSIPFPSDESWFGKKITIVKKGKSPDAIDSEPQTLTIGTRPKAPSNIKTTPAKAGLSDGTISGGDTDKDKLEYRASGKDSWDPIAGSTQTSLAAGKYDVRFRASNTGKKFASESVTVIVSSAVMTQESKPTVSINFIDEQLTGLKFGDKYLIDDTEITVEEGGVFKLPEEWLDTTIDIVKAGDGINTTNSDAFKLDIPARPKAPTGITTSNVTSKGNDGKLLNVSSKMEYWQKGTSPKVVVGITGNTEGNLPAGTYCVRFKAVEDTSFSSQVVEVVIGEYEPAPEEKPTAEIDYINESLIGLVAGASYHIVSGTTETDVTAKTDGSIPFPSDDSWLGKLITIVKKGKSPDSTDSEPQVLKIGMRPKAPSNIKTTPATAGQSDGIISGRTADKDKLEYRVSGTGSWIPITGSTQTDLAAGKYDVRFRASNTEEKFASESVTVTVSFADMTQERTPNVSINFKKEQLIGLTIGEEYLIDDTEVTLEKGEVFELPEEWFDSTIYIVKAGDGINTTDSDAFELYIPPRPSAPADVKTEDISAKGAKNGKLLNLKDTMEYRSEDVEEYTPVPNNRTQVTGLAAGIYYVRFKATDSSFCSEDVELIIMDFEPVVEATPAAQIDYEKEELTGLIKGTYLISTDDTESSSVDSVKVGTDERIVIKDKWFGCTLYIVRKGNGYATENSEAQPLYIPERPDAPSGIDTVQESKKGAKDGKLTNVDNTMAYQKKGTKDWTPVVEDEVAPLAPGVYLVCYKAVIGKDFRSESAEYTISAFELIPADTPENVEISYEDEYFMYLTPGVDYKINGVTVSADTDGKIRIRDAWMNREISIIELGDGVFFANSAPYPIKVPGRHSPPDSVKAVSESAEDANDGKLTGVNDEMAYRVADGVEDSEANWIQIDTNTSTVENLEPAKYKIRYMATDNSFSSKSVTRIVYAYGSEPKTPDKNKEDHSDKEDSNEEQEIPTDENSSSSQTENGSAGGGTAGNAGSKLTGGLDKNTSADGTDVATNEENTDENGADSISQNTLTGQNTEIGSGINSGNDHGNKSNKGNAGKTETADGASENEAGLAQSENGSLAETAGDGGASVYIERSADRMSSFYDFLLRLADSRNLVWIAIILAEPILFLLLLIYLLGRKKRDAECQTEN